jgi:hypothetical protein
MGNLCLEITGEAALKKKKLIWKELGFERNPADYCNFPLLYAQIHPLFYFNPHTPFFSA